VAEGSTFNVKAKYREKQMLDAGYLILDVNNSEERRKGTGRDG